MTPGVWHSPQTALQASEDCTSALQKLLAQQPKEATVDEPVSVPRTREVSSLTPFIRDGFRGRAGFKLAFEE